MGKSRLGNQTKRLFGPLLTMGRLRNRQDGGDEEETQRPDESRAGAELEDIEET